MGNVSNMGITKAISVMLLILVKSIILVIAVIQGISVA